MALLDWLNELNRLRIELSKGNLSFHDFLHKKELLKSEGEPSRNPLEGITGTERFKIILRESERIGQLRKT